MTSKLALHLQAHVNLPTAAAWIKIIDPPAENRWPGLRVVGRVYMPDNDSNALVARGAAGADEWFRFCQPSFARCPWVFAWEGPNEPQPVADLAFCHQLSAFTIRLAELMHGAGLRIVGGNLSEGNPGGNEAERRDRFQAIARGLVSCDYWSQHCYWVLDYPHPEAGINEWHAFRYRMNERYAAEAGIVLPPLLITECGVDGGVVGRPKRGWRTFCRDRAHYVEQLAAFDAELANDPSVLAATVFTAGPMGWEDFEVDREMNDMINAHIRAQGGSYAPAAPSAPPALGNLLNGEFGADYEDLSMSLPRHATLLYQERALAAIDRVVLHHTEASRSTTWQSVAQYHVNGNGWPGIGYHIGIRHYGSRAVVSLLNDPRTRSYHAHTVGNDRGLAVCVAGQFDRDLPTAEERDALRRVVAVVERWRGWALPVVGHGSVPGNSTDCPGQHLRALLPALNAPPTLPALILAAADAAQVIQFNPNASLQRRIFADGFVPNSPEIEVEHGGIRYIVQRAEHLASGEVRAYYVPLGDWANVQHVTR